MPADQTGSNFSADRQPPVLELRGICKHFGKLKANDNINLSLYQGEILALLGENGAGKTTLMNILFGHYSADQGDILVFGKSLAGHSPDDALRAGIGMVHQHFTLADNLTVLDNIILGTESLWLPVTRRKRARQRIQHIIDSAGLAVEADKPIRELAVGERQRVEILKALYRDARILILDEPTAVLTPQEVDDLFVLLRSMVVDGLSIIIISHKLHEVMAISDRVVVLRHGRVVGSAATADVDRDQLAEMIVGRHIERPVSASLQAGKSLLAARAVTVNGIGSKRRLLDAINLTIAERQIVGVAGVSGNGQAVLADVLSGIRQADAGELLIDGKLIKSPTPRQLTKLGIARIPEDRQSKGVVGDMNLWENLLLDDLGEPPCWRFGMALDRQAARQRARALIDSFDIRSNGDETPAYLLSGGNMQKLILARNLSRAPRIILANQPTRGLDEGAIAAVHQLLIDARDGGAGVLLIAEDLDELLRLSDVIVVMHNGGLSDPVLASDVTARQLGLQMSGALNP